MNAGAADRREGGAWRSGQRLKNDLIYALSACALGILSLLPRAMLTTLGRWVGRLAYVAFPGARRTAQENAARLRPEASPALQRALARRCYARLGEHLGDVVAMLGGAPLAPLPFASGGALVLERAIGEGHGVLFVSAHLGPWERVAGSVVAAGVPLTTLARDAYDPRFTRLYDRLRSSLGVRVVYRGGPGASSRILRVLKEGGVLGVPMDLRSRVPSIPSPFLGSPAPTAVGPARIALRTGAAVVVATVARRGADLALTVTRIPAADLAPGTAGEHALTSRINEELGARIMALPHEWVLMHPRWPPVTRASASSYSVILSEAKDPPDPARFSQEGDARRLGDPSSLRSSG